MRDADSQRQESVGKGENMTGVVISGPTGAIGMALIEKCIRENTRVLAICHKGSARIRKIPESLLVRVVEADLADYRQLFREEDDMSLSLPAEPGRYDVFYHFAWSGTTGEARNDMHLQTDNIAYTMDAVDLAERLGCHTFIGAGSQAEYGRVDGTLTSDIPVHPENGYGMAKLCAGQMSRVVCERKRIRHIWTRILSVYGPYDGSGSMVMSAVRKIRNGEPTAFTPGEQMWDYLYSRDAAEIFYALGEKGRDGAVYCVGSGQARELKSYIRDIDAVIREDRGEQTVETEEEQEKRLGIGLLPYAEKQVMYLCADTTLLEEQIGPIPHTGFKEGILSILKASEEY